MKRICPHCKKECRIGLDVYVDDSENIVCNHCDEPLYLHEKKPIQVTTHRPATNHSHANGYQSNNNHYNGSRNGIGNKPVSEADMHNFD